MEDNSNVVAIEEAIDQALVDKCKALKQLINVHDLLNQGQFPGYHNKRIGEALDFVQSLHKQLLAEAQEHPQSNKIAELIQKV